MVKESMSVRERVCTWRKKKILQEAMAGIRTRNLSLLSLALNSIDNGALLEPVNILVVLFVPALRASLARLQYTPTA